ncbi:hypothetical protein IW152_001965, partial [Coemansia sp. BCRC 34962]
SNGNGITQAKPRLFARAIRRMQGSRQYGTTGSVYHEERRVFGVPQIGDHDIFSSLDSRADMAAPDGEKKRLPPQGTRPAQDTSATSQSSKSPGLRAWSEKEEQQLIDFIKKTFAGKAIVWDTVAVELNRTGIGCMAKYYSLLELLADHE